jgi:uncharacterized protein YmfQ (DUF2313 family)
MSDELIEQLQSLLPPVSYDPRGQVLGAQLAAEAGVLGDAVAGLEAVEAAMFPQTAGEFIADWERVYGLTPAPGATQDDRVQAVIAAMSDLGGQSIPYFVRLASLFGVKVGVEVFRIPVVGLLNTGDPIYFGDWPYIWRVNSPIAAAVNTPMEVRISDRRPANTEVIFGYGKEVMDVVANAADQIFHSVNYVIPSSIDNG